MTDIDAGRDDRVDGLSRTIRYDPALTRDAPVDVEGATVVLLIAAPGDRHWAAAAAVGLSGAWARDGRRVVLADMHLESPLLHEVTGNRNLEGVVDVFLYGASIARSARPVSGEAFFLIPAGTYDPDAEAIYHHPRWPKIVAGFRDAGATLVLFVPASSSDVGAISEWVDRVVVLGDAGSGAALGTLASRGVEPSAALVPQAVDGGAPRVVPTTGAEEAAAVVPSLPATANAAGPAADAAAEMRIPPAPRRRRRRPGRGMLTALLVLAAAAVVAAAGYLVARYRPDLVPGARATASPVEETASAARSGTSRAGDPLPYSVQVKAFNSLRAAVAQVREERARFTAQPFFVSPEEIQGILYFKVLSGLAADTVEAKSLRTQLVEAGSVEEEEAVGSWSLIQFTPLAFDLGEYETEARATARADSLAELDVPAYLVAVPYADGSRRWQLYGGGYRDSLSADAMRQRLTEAGITPRLVARIGQRAGSPR